jgi:SAM-dependent methyltransferase
MRSAAWRVADAWTVMSLFLRLIYGIGFTPWEDMQEHAAGRQALTLLEREENEREPPYGRALDLGCGSGIWSIKLAARGWDVTGVDIVPTAVRRARERASEANVNVEFIQSDIAALQAAGVGSGFQLVLDFGAVHGLNDEQREAVGQQVSAATVTGATLLMYAMGPGRRGPLPRGMSRRDVEATYPGWKVIDEEAFDASGLPGPMRKSNPRWYRLRRA